MNNKIQKAETFKSGHFVFSLAYNEAEINNLLTEIKILYAGIKDIPIVPKFAIRFNEDLLVSSIHGTDGIEGNPLSEEEVRDVIFNKENNEQNVDWKQRIKNIESAYRKVIDMPISKQIDLNEESIKAIHEEITKNTNEPDNVAGNYRNHEVKVGTKKHGGIDIPPKILPDIKSLMSYFIKWINSDLVKKDSILRAGLAHYYLAKIHPFGDGNGRVARVIEALLLKSAGIKHANIVLPKYYKKQLDDYYVAFSLVRKSKDYDITPFLKFYLNNLILALQDIKKQISFFVRVMCIKDYVLFLQKEEKKINNRQCDFMLLLLTTNSIQEFSLNDLFTNIHYKNIFKDKTEMTARRDLKGLENFRLIKKNKNNKYELNLKALE